jgi:DNA-binding beta-propeller fold protein YncE
VPHRPQALIWAEDFYRNAMEKKIRMPRLMIIAIFVALTACLLVTPYGSATDIKLWYRAAIYQDGKEGALLHPEGVACLSDASLIAADSGNGRLLRFRIDAEFILVESVEVKVPQLKTPSKIQIGRGGEIFVLDRKSFQIVRLAPDGRFISVVKPAGQPRMAVKSFATHPTGDLYVIDLSTQKVLVMTPGGSVRAKIDFPAGTAFLSDITVDPIGRVLAVDGVAGIVFALDAAGRVFAPLTDSLKPFARYPSALSTDAGGRIYISDRNGGRILVLSSTGGFLDRLSARGWKEGLLQYPSQICISPRGRISVADTLNNRVQIFEVSN